MHLLTNIDVTVPVTAGGSMTGKLKAEILNPIGIEVVKGGYSSTIKYSVVVDSVEHDVLQAIKGRIDIAEAEFQAIYDAVESGLPADTDMFTRLVTLGYEVVKVKMVEEFTELTATSEIDIV